MTDAPPVTHVHGSHNPLSVLTKKIGPAPGWVWVVVIVGGYVGYRWYSARKGNTTVSSTVGTDTADTPASGSASSVDGGAGSGSVSTGMQNQATPTGPTTNAQWGQQAVAYLSSTGNDPVSSSNAIYAYLSKAPLTAVQNGLVTKALSALGSPPEGIIPVTTVPLPSQVVNPRLGAPHNQDYRVYNVPAGSGVTLAHISTWAYGTTKYWVNIRNYNNMPSSYTQNSKIKAGTAVRVPDVGHFVK